MTSNQVTSNSVDKSDEVKVAIVRVIRTSDQSGEDKLTLDDGTSTADFDDSLLSGNQLRTNKLYRVKYIVESNKSETQRKIVSCEEPRLLDVSDFNGYHFSDGSDKESHDSFWAAPIINIESIALFDTIAEIQKLLAQCNKFIEPEEFCIAKPSCFCDFSGILSAVDNTAFNSQLDKDIAIAGSYLFCIYRSYFAVKSEGKDVTNFDLDILKFIERTLNNLAKTNAELSQTLRQFIRLSELNENENLSKLCVIAVLVKDFYDVLQPAKDRARYVWSQRYAAGLEDY